MVNNPGIGFDSCHVICLSTVVNIILTSKLSKVNKLSMVMSSATDSWLIMHEQIEETGLCLTLPSIAD